MTKLKTLNDLREKGIWLSEENAEILKQEAIKWVKIKSEFLPEMTRTETTGHKFQISWIMHFFNITEDDLK